MAEKFYIIAAIIMINCLMLKSPQFEEYPCGFNPKWKPIVYVMRMAVVNGTHAKGTVEIYGTVTSNTKKIMIHSKVIIKKISHIYNGTSHDFDLSKIDEDEELGTLTLTFQKLLREGEPLRLSFTYTANIRTKDGIYLTFYQKIEKTTFIEVATSFQPNYARYAFPCIDLPNMKARFQITLVRPKSMVALTNSQLNATITDVTFKHIVWDFFQPSPVMSPYLVAFAIGKYKSVKLNSMTKLWGHKLTNGSCEYAAASTQTYLRAISNFTQVKYHHSKLDHIAIPYFPYSGMENWGFISYRPNKLFVDPMKSDIMDELYHVWTVAHETTHQFYGNLVTCDSWAYSWLNEGITTYVTNLIVERIQPTSNVSDFYLMSDVQNAMFQETITPITLTVFGRCTEEEVEESLVKGIYEKGAAMMYMLETIVSKKVLEKGLINLIKNNQYKTIKEEDLWSSIDQVWEDNYMLPVGESLSSVMRTWTRSPGFPYLQLERSNHNITISQINMFSNDYYWWIPLSFTTSSPWFFDFETKHMNFWIKPNNQTQRVIVLLRPYEWILFNIGQRGYYKVNYDYQSWWLISNFLKSNFYYNIDPMNRANLINDVFFFAKINVTNYRVAVYLMSYLVNENHHYPWITAIRVFNELGHVVSKNRNVLYSFIEEVLGKAYNRITSIRFQPKTMMERIFKRNLMTLACKINFEDDCRKLAQEATKMLMKGEINHSDINTDLRALFWCNAVRFGDGEVWEYVRSHAVERSDTMYTKALLCTKNRTLVFKMLGDKLLKEKYIISVSPNLLLKSFFSFELACDLIEFYKKNYLLLVNKFGRKTVEEHVNWMPVRKMNSICKENYKQLLYSVGLSTDQSFTNKWEDEFGNDFTEGVNNYFISLRHYGSKAYVKPPTALNVFIGNKQSDFYETFGLYKKGPCNI